MLLVISVKNVTGHLKSEVELLQVYLFLFILYFNHLAAFKHSIKLANVHAT